MARDLTASPRFVKDISAPSAGTNRCRGIAGLRSTPEYAVPLPADHDTLLADPTALLLASQFRIVARELCVPAAS